MNLKTLMTIRNLYFMGVALLILNTFPRSREILATIYDYPVFGGITVVMIIGILTAAGAFMAFKRRI